MPYSVIVAPTVQRSLKRLQPKLRKRIIGKLKDIEQDPYATHHQATKLQGREGYRLRIGDWRVIHTLEDKKLLLHALDVQSRGNAYKH